MAEGGQPVSEREPAACRQFPRVVELRAYVKKSSADQGKPAASCTAELHAHCSPRQLIILHNGGAFYVCI